MNFFGKYSIFIWPVVGIYIATLAGHYFFIKYRLKRIYKKLANLR